jgi:hypothetical protein
MNERTAYQAVKDLLARLDSLIRAGQGDSEKADDVRDALDAPWRQLTPAQQRLLAARQEESDAREETA